MMKYQFPCSRFVETNGVWKQLLHILSEFSEVCRAVVHRDWEHTVEELWDVIHSCETLLRILEKKYAVKVRSARMWVKEKNDKRGYYQT